MEKKTKSRLFRWFFGILGVFMAMYICAEASYYIVRKKAPSQQSKDARTVQDNIDIKEDKPFPNLPVTISGTYSQEENFTQPDMNDYLVVAEETLVKLYSVNENGDKIFEKVLEIDISSLKTEDQTLLKKGILLDNMSDVLSLIEDYSS